MCNNNVLIVFFLNNSSYQDNLLLHVQVKSWNVNE